MGRCEHSSHFCLQGLHMDPECRNRLCMGEFAPLLPSIEIDVAYERAVGNDVPDDAVEMVVCCRAALRARELEKIATAAFPLDGTLTGPDKDGGDQLKVYALLSIINSPAIFHREILPSHKKLVRMAKTSWLRQIRPWHKINLSITREASISTGHHDGEITGERCLHWVRQHLRFRLGQWELVQAHERGNPEKGISLAAIKGNAVTEDRRTDHELPRKNCEH